MRDIHNKIQRKLLQWSTIPKKLVTDMKIQLSLIFINEGAGPDKNKTSMYTVMQNQNRNREKVSIMHSTTGYKTHNFCFVFGQQQMCACLPLAGLGV